MKYCMLLMAAGAALTIGGSHAQTRPAASPAQAGPAPVKAIVMMSAVMPSTDFERSKAFYVKGMGMTASPGANPRELVLSFPGGGSNLMLMLSTPAAGAPPRAPGSAILQVPDMKALVASLSAAGYAMKGNVVEMAQYHISVGNVEDPDGNHFEIIARSQ
jgi:predicted enzyme related to lactoylglutathione lyase